MRRHLLSVFFFSMCVTIVSCSQTDENTATLSVDFQSNPPCTSSFVSPQITLGNIPEGTVKFYVELTDLDLPAFDHGSGFATFDEQPVIPAGAVRGSYAGPSPPYGVIHDYEIKVKAMDAENKVLGVGQKALRYPPEGEEELHWMPCEK